MPFEADPVHRGLHGAIQQFNNEYQQHGGHQQCPFHAGTAQPQAHGYDQDAQGQFLAKCGLPAVRAPQALPAGRRGLQDAGQAPRLLTHRRLRGGHDVPDGYFAVMLSGTMRPCRIHVANRS